MDRAEDRGDGVARMDLACERGDGDGVNPRVLVALSGVLLADPRAKTRGADRKLALVAAGADRRGFCTSFVAAGGGTVAGADRRRTGETGCCSCSTSSPSCTAGDVQRMDEGDIDSVPGGARGRERRALGVGVGGATQSSVSSPSGFCSSVSSSASTSVYPDIVRCRRFCRFPSGSWRLEVVVDRRNSSVPRSK